MMFTNAEEIITLLPKSIRESVPKADLISHIIVGYKQLQIPQDIKYEIKHIHPENHKYVIDENVTNLISVWMIEDDKYKQIFGNIIDSDLCRKCKQCKSCEDTYSINYNILTLPKKDTGYCLLVTTFESDNLLIFNDPIIKEYLKYWVLSQELLDRSISGDVNINIYGNINQSMNVLYTKASGNALLRNIKLQNYIKDISNLNLTIDEFNYRFPTITTTRE